MSENLTNHEKRLWERMLALCNQFLNREVDLGSLVTGLEGLLDAGDFRDKKLRDTWYSLWVPLEVRNAVGEVGWSPDALREAEALRSYLASEVIRADGPPS